MNSTPSATLCQCHATHVALARWYTRSAAACSSISRECDMDVEWVAPPASIVSSQRPGSGHKVRVLLCKIQKKLKFHIVASELLCKNQNKVKFSRRSVRSFLIVAVQSNCIRKSVPSLKVSCFHRCLECDRPWRKGSVPNIRKCASRRSRSFCSSARRLMYASRSRSPRAT